MKIAVLGAHGFVGQKLCAALIEQGHEITGYVLNPEIEKMSNLEYKSVRELINGSLFDLKPFDITINLAARRSTRSQFFTDKEVNDFTYEIPKQFILRTSNPNTIVINASTYIQNFEGNLGLTIDSYGAAKQRLSLFLEKESDSGRFKTRDLFFFTLYGIGDRSSHLVPLLINAAKSGENIALSPGHQLLNLLHITDAVHNITNCISQTLDTSYCKNFVWSDEYFSVRELVSRIQLIIDRKINVIWGGREYAGHEMMKPWPIPMLQLPGFTAPTELEKGIKSIWNTTEKA